MTAMHLRQIWLVARLQLARVFFSRRSFWVYGLALFPSIVFIGRAIDTTFTRASWSRSIVAPAILEAIREGDTDEQVLARAAHPVRDNSFEAPAGIFEPGRRGRQRQRDDEPQIRYRSLRYFDGRQRWDLNFEAGVLKRINSEPLIDFQEDRSIFAAIFQQFYLRLAVFFGCLGIFINLFRGEMLDKTLHFWFLAPMRREVLLAGKYLAGLITAASIFTLGAVVAYAALLWPQDTAQVTAFWNEHGARHMFWYAASAALACLGYGSVFLAAGMWLRNPIIPASVILAWESVNGALPAIIQKLSVLHYVGALAPVPPPIDSDAPLLIRLLAAPAEPPSALVAVLGLLTLTAAILWLSARTARKLEINYGSD